MMINQQKNKLANNKKDSRFKKILFQLCLVIIASILFTLSFPNLLFKNGLPFLAWFAYVPVLLLIPKNSLLQCVGWGAVYGFITYLLFNYWLWAFHPFAGAFVYCLYLSYMIAVFFFMKLADLFFPRRAYLVQWVIWLTYEYLRTKGFLGFPYGITGYSQWQVLPLIQIAGITGVWGVSALVTFPSFWLAEVLRHFYSEKNQSEAAKSQVEEPRRSIFFPLHSFCAFAVKKRFFTGAIIWAAVLTGTFVFGFFSLKDFSGYPAVQIALVQHNTHPWEASNASSEWQKLEAYRKDLTILKRLSEEALLSNPKPVMIVWPETAFVPRIFWHTTYRKDQDMWLLVKELLDYLSLKDIPFLIGNDDARMDPVKNPDEYDNFKVDYNAAILFENGKITEIYRKQHLVPFTEHFPYAKQFPFIYRALLKMDTHFWEKGEEATVFKTDDFSFSVPICFEDTFGYLVRNFVRRGADVLVNISNDAWSNSLPCQKQHLSMAVFRAVENYRPMVRSTVSGQTCVIDPNGRVIMEAPAFKEAWLNAAVPLAKRDTIYTLLGDYLGIVYFLTAFIALLSAAICYIIGKMKRGRQ